MHHDLALALARSHGLKTFAQSEMKKRAIWLSTQWYRVVPTDRTGYMMRSKMSVVRAKIDEALTLRPRDSCLPVLTNPNSWKKRTA